MKLKVVLPARILVEQEVARVSAESSYGTFTILPNHIDFATMLVPGLLLYRPPDDREYYLAVDEGFLVKVGAQILVSTGSAVAGEDLSQLKKTVRTEFHMLNERERRARTALARLESDFIRRYVEFRE